MKFEGRLRMGNGSQGLLIALEYSIQSSGEKQYHKDYHHIRYSSHVTENRIPDRGQQVDLVKVGRYWYLNPVPI